jgi:hypothetical protein
MINRSVLSFSGGFREKPKAQRKLVIKVNGVIWWVIRDGCWCHVGSGDWGLDGVVLVGDV